MTFVIFLFIDSIITGEDVLIFLFGDPKGIFLDFSYYATSFKDLVPLEALILSAWLFGKQLAFTN